MRTRDLLDDTQATLVLMHNFQMMDAETLLAEAPSFLLQRIARDAGLIARVPIWDTSDPYNGFALTMSNTKEVFAEWCDHMESQGVDL